MYNIHRSTDYSFIHPTNIPWLGVTASSMLGIPTHLLFLRNYNAHFVMRRLRLMELALFKVVKALVETGLET